MPVHEEALGEDLHILRALVPAVRLALDNQRLTAEVRAQLADQPA